MIQKLLEIVRPKKHYVPLASYAPVEVSVDPVWKTVKVEPKPEMRAWMSDNIYGKCRFAPTAEFHGHAIGPIMAVCNCKKDALYFKLRWGGE